MDLAPEFRTTLIEKDQPLSEPFFLSHCVSGRLAASEFPLLLCSQVMSWSESSVFQGMSGMAGFAEASVRASAPPHPLCVSLPPLLSLVLRLVSSLPVSPFFLSVSSSFDF